MSNRKIIKEIIFDVTGPWGVVENPSDIKGKMTFESLGMDSMDYMETVMEIEDGFNIHIDDAILEKWVTVNDAIKYMDDLQAKVGE